MRIIIKNIKWNIKYTNNKEYLKRNNGTYTIGMCDVNNRTIYVYDKLEGVLLIDVLIHEITHAYIHSYGYILSEDEEEFLCEFVSKYSYSILNNVEDVLNKGMDKIARKYLQN